ncbi:MAG: alpha amylase C-terminal domain-containing protein [Bacteroidales bacterium]|nr:alpha amylase C-terminal domain-containing protein [Bacteroidales bacterium]
MAIRKIYETDPWLEPFKGAIDARHEHILADRKAIAGDGRLADAVNNHLYYGLHHSASGWTFREWAPNATRIYLVGDFNNWKRTESYALKPVGNGSWEITLPEFFLHHGDLYKLFIEWPGGGAERLPSYATRVVQNPETKIFSAQVWAPAKPYEWTARRPGKRQHPLIYECHIGMSGEEEKVASFEEFRTQVLPRVKALGYNVLQIMALQEHPYYGSFGYQVSNFYALSSRFGTPEEFKHLVDDAHRAGIAVIMDIVHSHMVKNEAEGLSRFDGREDIYFYNGWQGHHPAWDSRCFDYGKNETKFFLLSNCKFWMEEYHLDGFRFDGVTSMLYWDHGLEKDFGDYALYFNKGVDENAVSYLALANMLIHEMNPNALTIAEDMSGMAGLAAPFKAGGIGFDFRMAMGIADHWIKWIKELSDEQWSMGSMWWELTNKRADENTISYAECHDQALVGDKTIIFRLIDKEMYFHMDKASQDLTVERGMALHKMIRLVTLATNGGGYLNFMGNEFGHPEWIDFPREGNGWSFKYARRQWSLADNGLLRYGQLRDFDSRMIHYVRSEKVLEAAPVQLYCDEERKVLIFSRGNTIFAFNFNPVASYENFSFWAPDGEYTLAFDSDEAEFGGFSRLQKDERHSTVNHNLALYLPSRCAIVLKKTK